MKTNRGPRSLFDRVVDELKSLATEPIAKFAGTTHTVEDLEKVASFIRDVKVSLDPQMKRGKEK